MATKSKKKTGRKAAAKKGPSKKKPVKKRAGRVGVRGVSAKKKPSKKRPAKGRGRVVGTAAPASKPVVVAAGDGEVDRDPKRHEIRQMRVADLIEMMAAYNPREISAEAMAGLEASLDRFGVVQPVVWNERSRTVVGGHQRLRALSAKGVDDVDVVVVDLDDTEEKALNVALNSPAIAGEFTLELDTLLAEIQAGEPDLYDELLLDSLRTEPEKELGPAPEPQTGRADELREKWQTERGQVWAIGEHRLMCGDCRSGDVRRFPSKFAAMAITSPPYAEQRKEQYGGIPSCEYVEWWDAVQSNTYVMLRDDGSFFVNIKPHVEDGERSLYVFDMVCSMVRDHGWDFVDEFCWLRAGVPKMVKYRFKNAFEPIYHFARDAKSFKFNPDAVKHDSESVPVARGEGAGNTNWAGRQGTASSAQVDTGNLFGPAREKGKAYPSNVLKAYSNTESLNHPAAFAVKLVAFFILAYTDQGDAVYEPFSGSGTTMVAAEQLGRVCYGMEIEPKYVAVTLERMAEMGLSPRLVVEGE